MKQEIRDVLIMAGIVLLSTGVGALLAWQAMRDAHPAADLRQRLALVAIERAACMETCGTPEACARCADVAQERIEGETSLVLEGIERTQPKP